MDEASLGAEEFIYGVVALTEKGENFLNECLVLEEELNRLTRDRSSVDFAGNRFDVERSELQKCNTRNTTSAESIE